MANILLGEGFAGIGGADKEWQGNATTATKAEQAEKDSEGNNIAETYAKKSDLANVKVNTMVGATESADGKSGLVPTPPAGAQDKFLRGDGTWQEVNTDTSANTGTVIINAYGYWMPAKKYPANACVAIFKNSTTTVYLECVTAGISSTSQPDVSSATEGMAISDGSVKWKVISIHVEIPQERPSWITANKPSSTLPSCDCVNAMLSNDNAVRLSWVDPNDSGDVRWVGSMLVRKKGSIPQTPEDGDLLDSYTARNKYKTSPYVDILKDVREYKYRVFPVFSGAMYCSSPTNAFNYYDTKTSYHHAIYIDEADAVEPTCVHQVEGYDNYGYKPIKMLFAVDDPTNNNVCDMGDWDFSPIMPKPCMLKNDGTVAYYLDPNDYTKKADGTASDVANASFAGNAMIEWDPIYIKAQRVGTKLYLYYCNTKYDPDYECYSCLKADGTYAKHFYTPIYPGSVASNKMRSISGVATSTAQGITMDAQMNYARANGNGWEISTWNDEDLIRCLGPLVLGRLNTQQAIGFGQTCSNYSYTTGVGNKKGMFWGGSPTAAHANGTKFFGMENWWGHCYRRVAGVLTDGNRNMLVKNTRNTKDGSTATNYNTTGDGYKNLGVIASGSGYVKSINGKKGSITLTTNNGGSATTYFCDYGYVNSGYVLEAGYNAYANAGLFVSYLNYAASYAYSSHGASLSYHTL